MSENYNKPWTGLAPHARGNKAWETLNEIGKAIEKANGKLPSVRRDSPQWQAWRTWLHMHDLPTTWSDRQPSDLMMTVTLEWPPSDLELLAPNALIARETGKHTKELKE